MAILVAILLSAGAATRDYFLIDLMISRTIQEIDISPWNRVMETASVLGTTLPMACLSVGFFCWFLFKRQRAEYVVLGSALLSFGLNPILKLLIDRPRPTEELVTIWRDSAGMGFPSGHAYTSMVLFGLLFYLAPTMLSVRRSKTLRLMRVTCLSMIALIGISRVYLGVHWPSDVLGGFLVGGIILSLLISLHRQYKPESNQL